MAGFDFGKLYARLPLLLSHQLEFLPFHRMVQEVPDELVADVHKKAHDQPEVGVALGTDLSLLDTAETDPQTGVSLCDAFRFRALLAVRDGHALAKGMLIINETLPGPWPRNYHVQGVAGAKFVTQNHKPKSQGSSFASHQPKTWHSRNPGPRIHYRPKPGSFILI